MNWQNYTNFLAHISLLFFIVQSNATNIHQECQDVIVNNVVVQPGLTDCQRYYNVIKSVLDRYKRPITVLDLGAGQGYFSFRIAHDYDSTCIMVESNDGEFKWADQLLDLCHLNSNLKNIILLNRRMTLQELQKLADCEHFDVVLAFDYIDPEVSTWKQTANEILRLGDNIFIQTPYLSNSDENMSTGNVVEFLAKRSGKLILQTPCVGKTDTEEQLFWFEYNKTRLRRKCFDQDNYDACMDSYRIESSYTQKKFIKKGSSSGKDWKKGINLVTFLMLNGAYPTRTVLKQAVAKHTQEKLTDFLPKNLIVQGNDIAIIDQNSRSWREANVQKSLRYINDAIDQTSISGVINMLKKCGKRHERKRKNWFLRVLGV